MEQQESEVTKREPSTGTPPVTPQSIVKDMFPDAPEKAQSIACFRSVTPEMSIYEIVQKCGRRDEEVGSGFAIFVYHLNDGSTVAISAAYLPKIDAITYTDRTGKASTMFRRK